MVLWGGGGEGADLTGSNPQNMKESLKKLASLPEETIVYPGHDYGKTPTSTIGLEKRNNPFMEF